MAYVDDRNLVSGQTYLVALLVPTSWTEAVVRDRMDKSPPGAPPGGTWRVLEVTPGASSGPTVRGWWMRGVWFGPQAVLGENAGANEGVTYPAVYRAVDEPRPEPLPPPSPSPAPGPTPAPSPTPSGAVGIAGKVMAAVLLGFAAGFVGSLVVQDQRARMV